NRPPVVTPPADITVVASAPQSNGDPPEIFVNIDGVGGDASEREVIAFLNGGSATDDSGLPPIRYLPREFDCADPRLYKGINGFFGRYLFDIGLHCVKFQFRDPVDSSLVGWSAVAHLTVLAGAPTDGSTQTVTPLNQLGNPSDVDVTFLGGVSRGGF